jgi:hypothetical protein
VSTVNEWVVREYFESLGYLVNQPCKYISSGRQKRAEEEVDLVVVNPRVTEHRVPENMVWTADDLRSVGRAVVAVRGWHTNRFYPSRFEHDPDILRFLQAEPLKFAAKLLGTEEMAHVLCLPKLPASGELKDQSIRVLRQKGVHGVISFHTMLAELIRQVDVNRNYEKSDLLQIVRLLKNYDLLRLGQMDLFSKKHHRRAAAPKAKAEPEPAPKPPAEN